MNSKRIVASLSANPVIKYAYSDVKLVSGNNYSATCKYCQYGNNKVSFSKSSYANLKRHLEIKHTYYLKFLSEEIESDSDAREESRNQLMFL